VVDLSDLHRRADVAVLEHKAVPVTLVESQEEPSGPGEGAFGGPGEITDAGAQQCR
jgi:hypothetical protein